MLLPSFLQRLRGQATSAQSEAELPPLSASDVEAARVRARRRLIGMVVLVGAGIIGFPWLFETQPRPMSEDVQMVRGGVVATDNADTRVAQAVEVAREVAKVQMPTPETMPPAPDEVAEEVVTTAQPPVRSASVAQEAGKAVAKAEPKVSSKVEPKPDPKPAAKPASKAEAKPVKPTDADGVRYVVQVGAYSDGITAHEVRMKVKRLGLDTYTQEVKTAQGVRIRVRLGPYGDRAEAEKAQASLRKAGLTGAVLTL
jgi:DedD protein